MCKPSPTGAHHWICEDTYEWRCKFCLSVAFFPLTMEDALLLGKLMLKGGWDAGYSLWLRRLKDRLSLLGLGCEILLESKDSP